MFESSTSQGAVKLGKRPATSSATPERRGKKRAIEWEEESHELIELTVKSQEKEVHFKVKSSTKMEKILRMFCQKARVEYRTMRFFIDCRSFPANQTPDELHLSNGDEIEALGWLVNQSMSSGSDEKEIMGWQCSCLFNCSRNS